MNEKLTRRRFLAAAAAVSGIPLFLREGQAQNGAPNVVSPGATPPGTPVSSASSSAFAFPLLGDLHFDRLEHHDMPWMEKEYPNDIRQVQNYSRITAEVTPQLFSSVREVMSDLTKNSTMPVPFVMHIGDFVEGVCGSQALSQKQNEDAIAFVHERQLGAPFLFCKGNHDITGPGAKEAFNSVLLPFLTRQKAVADVAPKAAASKAGEPIAAVQNELTKACYTVQHGNALFAFFDAYDHPHSLNWLEETLNNNTARHVFVLIHPPVVPYGARTTWHLYSRANEVAERTRLLNVLGKHNAIVLSGHLHKYNLMTRRTETGRFLQLAVNSVVPRPDAAVGDVLEGVDKYTPDQIKVEPKHSPQTETERRAIITAEAPHVDYFEYAEAPGYAVITVQGEQVQMQYYTGAGRTLWKTRDLSAILKGQKA